ncbi:MAG: Protein of unknown function (DUF2442) [Candidatus Kentron sp. G]|nr:MAG: Protein of unknown function (DUF2442) [Candidatus Kentron sp. G]VFN00758.1 MAG: Protein of unknown function (DUF2442) [Candidatus Kentron sp. G]VFN01472.1 MAG: Protein of unknown function (DUF2442) [Candidatus Kentron sp. G]
MRIVQVTPQEGGFLHIVAEDGRSGIFDVRPYLESPAFRPLEDWEAFSRIHNGGYFVEWQCGADLSADTMEMRWEKGATCGA